MQTHSENQSRLKKCFTANVDYAHYYPLCECDNSVGRVIGCICNAVSLSLSMFVSGCILKGTSLEISTPKTIKK